MRNDPEKFRDKPEILDILHYGVKRRSGRYPWGSGDAPYQHSGDFISRVETLKKETGVTKESELIKLINQDMNLNMSSKEYRIAYKVANDDRRKLLAARAKALREDGLTLDQIAAEMGYNNDSSVRQLLNESIAARKAGGAQTAELFKDQIAQKGMLDVGEGVEKQLGISRGQVEDAIYRMGLEGYNVYGVSIPQATNPSNRTTVEVLADKDITYAYAVNHKDQIQPVDEFYSHDGGETFTKLQYPASISSDRVAVRYGDEGGKSKDGVIEIRRGVDDVSLGESSYAQVRILVDGDKYLKGMAIYSDDIPDGYDILFNTNKSSSNSKADVMKPIKENPNDPDNPFGATIKANGQVYYTDKDGNKKLGVVNKLKEEGEWDEMSRNLSSQFLSKQPLKLAKQQLKLEYDTRNAELDEIMSLENPTVKRKYLMDFADECDAAAVHMKAAALPRQRVQVILPLTKIKDDEVYAPNFENGETLALVRYPHGGTFEIPIVKVNNNNQESQRILGKAKDAIGISSKTAERLSGADFDGDTVVAIPVNARSPVKSTPALRALKDFDPKDAYATKKVDTNDSDNPKYVNPVTGKTVSVMSEKMKQRQMGSVSNLITDMTLKGAPEDDIAKAVKHSMVVIDAVKHKLDYKQSEIDNDIATLKERWQDGGGASTLLSRRKQDVQVPERVGSPRINPETGELEYKESGRTYTTTKTYKRTGETVATEHQAMSKDKLVLNTKDVRTLSSGTEMENVYADYCNQMKALANRARKEYTTTGRLKYNPQAAKEYEPETKSLLAQLNLCKANAPLERRAQILANTRIEAQKKANPGMDKSDLKKFRDRAIKEARAKVGTLKGRGTHIKISDRQWEAIQKGAISDNLLTQIMRYTDQDSLRKRAMPKNNKGLSTAQENRLKSMLASGYSQEEVARAMNISTSTVSEYSK